MELSNELKKYSKDDVLKFFDFSSNALAYGYITHNCQQYLRDLEVAKLLDKKFLPSGLFNNAESAKNWIFNRLEVNPDNFDSIFRRLQGEGAGEVDFVRKINGSLKGILYKAEYATNQSGNVANNVPGIDVIVKNRITGQVVNKYQIKSNWTQNTKTLNKTISDFLQNETYDKNTILVGPKELIHEAKKTNIPNRTIKLNTTQANKESAERLMKKTAEGDLESGISFGGATKRIAKGAGVAVAISVGISSLNNYLSYRNGEISISEAFDNVAKDGTKAAIVGGTLAGLSLIFPPGIIGLGIGIAVGITLQSVVDLAFGDGTYKKIVSEMYSINNLSLGYYHFAVTTYENMLFEKQFKESLIKDEIEFNILNKLSKHNDDKLIKSLKEFNNE